MAKALEYAGEIVDARQGAGEGGSRSIEIDGQGVEAAGARVVDAGDVVGPRVRDGVGAVGQRIEQGVGLAVDAQRLARGRRAGERQAAGESGGGQAEAEIGRRSGVIAEADRAGAGPALGVAAGLSALGAIAAVLMRQRQAAGALPAPIGQTTIRF